MGDLLGREPEGTFEDRPVAELEGEPDPPLRRNPWNVVLAVICALALVVALSFGLWSRSASSEASTARHQAAVADAERRDLADQQLAADRGRAHLNGAADGVSQAISDYQDALIDADDAERRLVEIQNQAVVLSNQGRRAAAVELLQSQGDVLLAEVAEKTAALDKSLAALRAKDDDLQAATHG